jgi:hypothetical protein
MIRPLLLFSFGLLLFSCGTQSTEQTFDSSTLRRASTAEVEALVEAFILAEDSSVIDIPAGFYELKTQLILDNKTAIQIKGAGMDQTVLSFRELKSGGEGVKIVGRDILIEELSIEDAPGDGI